MNTRIYQTTRRFLLLALLLLALSLNVFAAERETEHDSVYCFSADDFSGVAGIYVAAVPEKSIGKIYCGSRAVRPGDFLDASALERLTLKPSCDKNVTATLTYMPITDGTLGEKTSLCVRIRSSQNEAPVAQDMEFETYKNIPNDGTLKASDPEGDAVTYKIETQPRYGTVELGEDGHFVYTPQDKRVGKDSFTYSATDAKGAISKPATVKIIIKKPIDAASYADLGGSTSQFEAMWLCESGLMRGTSVLGTPCFEPDSSVTRGEFLVMLMKLRDISPEDATLSSGFQDEADAPAWMRPYLTAAMRLGLTKGASAEDLRFFPNRPITQQEAAVMVQRVLSLPQVESVGDFSFGSAVAAWAQPAFAAAQAAALPLDPANAQRELTRLDAANLLYAVAKQ